MYNFETICRTCSCTGELQYLFDGKHTIVADMFTDIIGLKIMKGDNYPQSICVYCLGKLKDAYYFKKQCIEIHTKLQEYIQIKNNQIINLKSESPTHLDIKEPEIIIKEAGNFLFHRENDDVNEADNISIKQEELEENVQNDQKYIEIKNEPIESKAQKLKTNNSTSEKQKSECSICLKKVLHLKEHLRMHANEKPFECEVCNMKFSIKRNWIRHMKIHTTNKQYSCNICNQKFNAKNALTEHVKSRHSTEKPFECELCDKRYKRKSHLQVHVACTHEKSMVSMEKLHLCNHCGKTFQIKRFLIQHERTHTGDKPYKCELCDRAFAQVATCRKHQKTHTGEKPHKCDYCGKYFAQSGTLKAHILIHTGDKPYKCDICDQRFRHSSHVTRHKRIHTGEKPYKCTVCGSQFAEAGNLTVHLRKHTGETPYVCSICNKGFYNSSRMKRHKRKHLIDINEQY